MSLDREGVILIHGLWMSGWELIWLGWRLRRRGFSTKRFSYPSRRLSPEENARALRRFIEAMGAPPHLVGHSLGGVVALHLLELAPDLPVGRVVALGSPLRGSRAAVLLSWWPIWRWLFGRAMTRGLDGHGPARVPPGRSMGVVAGTRGLGLTRLLLGGLLESPNDGVVTVTETRLPGAEHRWLKVSHMGLIFSRRVEAMTVAFLREGRFPEENGAIWNR